MNEKRFIKIKDSIEFQALIKKQIGVEDELLEEEIELLNAYESLRQENEQLKNNINKLQKELNEENFQCSRYAIKINDLKENNKQLKDNWIKLKEWVNKHYDYYTNQNDYIGGRLCFIDMKNKMRELEIEKEND